MRLTSVSALSSRDSSRNVFTRRDLEEACKKLCPSNKFPKVIQKRSRNTSKPNARMIEPDVGSQMKVLDAGVKLSAKKMNECKSQCDRVEKELKNRKDELIELKRESSALNEMLEGKNHEAQRIKELKNKIDLTNSESEKKLHYRLNLRHMFQRIQKNSVTLDAHMSAMIDSLDAAEKDRKKSKKMLGDIESALTKSLKDLERTIVGLDTERCHRQRTLAARESDAWNAKSMEIWRLKRESMAHEMGSSFGDAGKREINEKRTKMLNDASIELTNLKDKIGEKTRSLSLLEDTFSKVKQATGANELAELVNKINHHSETKQKLVSEKERADENLRNAKRRLERAQHNFSLMREEGFGDTPLQRMATQDINNEIDKEKMKGKMMKSTNARLEKVLVEIQQGGIGLYQRLCPHHSSLLDGEAPLLQQNANESAVQTAQDTLEMLKTSERVVTKMLETVGGAEIFRYSKADVHSGGGCSSLPIETDLESANIQGNNCRVEARCRTSEHDHSKVIDDDEMSITSGMENSSDGLDVILSRRSIKDTR